ncbi:Metal-dependent hydrolases of the beta-lactamase superfamily I [Liberibacter crescens BT-1]|uniref:Metal-dependent hydrolases of the beta-lactamase superfamily I n=1 Tax=Liberibacter crescens (strain BT-1) TaxID=1215343 RepID=L0EVB0_LIBCB|nr:Metal-dependent hydrolases of the beta-lactamase superfamily I [Liberibacter crescens BT-1]
MNDLYRFTILGCSSSPGVPRIIGDWGACNPENPRNRRTRSALMVSRITLEGDATTVIIDTGPDFRAQMIRENVSDIDAVLYTHAHADHVHGIDDLRGYYLKTKKPVPIYADKECMEHLRKSFGYCFEVSSSNYYPSIVEPFIIEEDYLPISIEGKGGLLKPCLLGRTMEK